MIELSLFSQHNLQLISRLFEANSGSRYGCSVAPWKLWSHPSVAEISKQVVAVAAMNGDYRWRRAQEKNEDLLQK